MIALTGLSVGQSTNTIPAFPGAEGFGAMSVGGRGGKVLFVTNLSDSGPGSLRAAVERDGPRTVIFRISGTIALESNLAVRNPCITIAGQTAPRDGICLKDRALSVKADHVIVRHLRCRPGDNTKSAGDAVSISSGKNIIVDHCSASWSVDETLSASTSGQLANVTVQWCIISESLNDSTHSKGSHGYGSLIRGGWGNGYTFHHNLYAHHHARLPRPGNYNDRTKDPDGFTLDFRNNVIYNWGGRYAGYNADGANGTPSITKMNFIDNYYKAGPDSQGNLAFLETTKTASAFFSGNSMNGELPEDPWSLVKFSEFSPRDLDSYKQSDPIPVPPVTTDDATTAYHRVLNDAGATLPERDEVDIRIINSVKTAAGKIIDDEDQVGGWPHLASANPPDDSDNDAMPDDWERRYALDPHNPADRNNDPDKDGYTNLEEYLNSTNP
jgi:pectate lyase